MLSLGEAIRKKQSAHTYKSIIKHLNWSRVKPCRAGVIPYINTNKGLVFAFGLDTQYRELTDFGGGVSYKKDKTAVFGALREFKEESLGVFGDFIPKNVSNSFVIYNAEVMILFHQVDVEPETINKQFHEKLKNEENPEVCDIVWLGEEEFKKSLDPKSRLIYVLVRDLIVEAGEIVSYLKS